MADPNKYKSLSVPKSAWEKLGEVEHSGSSVAAVDINFTPDDSVYKWYKLYIQDWRGNGGNPYWRIKTNGSTQTGSIYSTGGSGTANTGSYLYWCRIYGLFGK